MEIIIKFFLWIGSSREGALAFVCTAWVVSFGIAYIQYQLEEKKKWKEAEKAKKRTDTEEI